MAFSGINLTVLDYVIFRCSVSFVDSSSLNSGSFVPRLWTSFLSPVYLPHHWLGDHFVAVFLRVPSMRDVASKSFIVYVLFVYWLYCMALQDEICLQLARFHLYNFILAIIAECFIFNIFNRSFWGSRSWILFVFGWSLFLLAMRQK